MASGAFLGWTGGSHARLALKSGVESVMGNIIPVSSKKAEETSKLFQKYLVRNGASLAQAYTITASKHR